MSPEPGMEQLRVALRSGGITPAEATTVLAEGIEPIAKAQDDAGGALRTVAEAAPASEPAPESEPRRFLAFSDAAERLQAHVNLAQEAQTFARSLVRWGAILPDQVDSYLSWLQANAVMDESDLPELLQRLGAGEPWTPDFPLQTDEPDAALFKRLLNDQGIRRREWTPQASFREVDQNGRQIQSAAETPENPRITFSPNTVNVPDDFLGTRPERTANYWRQERRAEDMLRPKRWLTRFLASVDTGLRALNPETDLDTISPDAYRRLRSETLVNPDSGIDPYLLDGLKTVTQFPYNRTLAGNVLRLHWDADHYDRWVNVNGWSPGHAYDFLGPRPVLG